MTTSNNSDSSTVQDSRTELRIPESDIYQLYSLLADATGAAARGDRNECAHLAAEAKTLVLDLHKEHKDD